VAICTLGKKIEVSADYAIIGTCKTENIGIERVIVNVISNPSIRFFILAGPEVPGHRTGSSMTCLHEKGVDEDTRKIVDAPGAIPYIENVSLEGVERFRSQVEFINMMNVSNPLELASRVEELNVRNPGPYPEEAIWVEFRVESGGARPTGIGGSVALLPEFGVSYDPWNSLVARSDSHAVLSIYPSSVGVEVRSIESGTILVGKEI
jgi:tetrahydromethanopterin S-methyltransferase subunit A